MGFWVAYCWAVAGIAPATDLAQRELDDAAGQLTGEAGVLGGSLHGIPHVLTAHSLEPARPWKAEQLGGGYALSSWAERTAIEAADAVIAVLRFGRVV